MIARGIFLIVFALFSGPSAATAQTHYPQTYVLLPSAEKSAFDFSFDGVDGKPVDLAQFRGKVLLIVNTASQCGLVNQMASLQHMQRAYADRGLVVIAVPSNDFGGQEPLEGAALVEKARDEYGAEYIITGKTHVTGDKPHPFYEWASQQPRQGFNSGLPRWNFHKYLIGRDGRLVNSYGSKISPLDIVLAHNVEAALAAE